MYTLHFNANYDDTIRPLGPECNTNYVNVQLSSIDETPPLNRLIQRIANIDITQFIAVLGHTYTANVNNQLIGRTYSFNELQMENLEYVSGPHLECPNDLIWILYSVSGKYPYTVLSSPRLPPDADITLLGIVKLDAILSGTGPNAYYQFRFPTSTDEPYQLPFVTTVGDTVLATRIVGAYVTWLYKDPVTSRTLPVGVNGAIVQDMQLQITAD